MAAISTAIMQHSSSKVTASTDSKKKNSKSRYHHHHHKSKHSQPRHSSSSSSSSTEREYRLNSRKNNDSKHSNNKTTSSFVNVKSKKRDSFQSPHRRNHHKKTKSLSRSRSRSRSSRSSRSRSSDRPDSRGSTSRYRHKNSLRSIDSNTPGAYSVMPIKTQTRFTSSYGNGRGARAPYNRNSYNMMNMIQNMSNLVQQQPKNGFNSNNRFHQQFQNNYKRLKAGERINNLYQSSFPIQHVPQEKRCNFRLLGRNIFLPSDDEEEDSKTSGNVSKPNRRDSSSDSSSEDERRRNNKRVSTSTTTADRAKPMVNSRELFSDPAALSVLLAELTGAAVLTKKQERTKKYLEERIEKFKDYARFQQSQTLSGKNAPPEKPEEIEKKIQGLARRLQMKTIGLHDDDESQGKKRFGESSEDSDSDCESPQEKYAVNNNSKRSQVHLKTNNVTSFGPIIASSDNEHHSDGNDSDGSMRNLNEDLKPISYYIKDRERMLNEMFRCIRGHKFQAILPDILKTYSIENIKARCLEQLDILSKKRIRALLSAQAMTSSSGTEDSSDEDDEKLTTLTSCPSSKPTATPLTNSSKKSLPNDKFRPVQMQEVTECSSSSMSIHNTLSPPVIVGPNEDVNDYYEGFKKAQKPTNIRRNEKDDDSALFPDQSYKMLQPTGINLPKFEIKIIKSLTQSQQAHLNARRIANRQKEQQSDVRQEIDDLLRMDDFTLPNHERPVSSNPQYPSGLPPKVERKMVPAPPRKGSLGDLLKQRQANPCAHNPSSFLCRQRSCSLSSSDHFSRESSRERSESSLDKINEEDDMTDLAKFLNLNEEDELLLLQIEVEEEERQIRRQEKRKRKQQKKQTKYDSMIIKKYLDELIEKVHRQEDAQLPIKRPFDNINNIDYVLKKPKLDGKL